MKSIYAYVEFLIIYQTNVRSINGSGEMHVRFEAHMEMEL